MEHQFSGKSVRFFWTNSRGSPLFPFGTEREKFPYHLLNFPVSSLLSAKTITRNRIANGIKYKAPFRSVGLLILEKTLTNIQRSYQLVYSDKW